VLAYVSARVAGRRLRRHEIGGIVLSVLGLVALAVPLVGGERDGHGETIPIILWLAVTAVAALTVLGAGRQLGRMAVAQGPPAVCSSRSETFPRRWRRREVNGSRS
jgi:hypothetical protein